MREERALQGQVRGLGSVEDERWAEDADFAQGIPALVTVWRAAGRAPAESDVHVAAPAVDVGQLVKATGQRDKEETAERAVGVLPQLGGGLEDDVVGEGLRPLHEVAVRGEDDEALRCQVE